MNMKLPPALFVSFTSRSGKQLFNAQVDWTLKQLSRHYDTHSILDGNKDIQWKRCRFSGEMKWHSHAWIGDTKCLYIRDREAVAARLQQIWWEHTRSYVDVRPFDYSRGRASILYRFEHEWSHEQVGCNRHPKCRRKGGCLYETGKVQTPKLDPSHKVLLQAVR